MALPSKKQFTIFLVQFWGYVTQEASKHPSLSTLSDAMLDCVGKSGGLHGQKLAIFFEEEAYRKKQKQLDLLLAHANDSEATRLQLLKNALEQLWVAFNVVKNPLPFEVVDRVLPFAPNLFEIKGEHLLQIHCTEEDFQEKRRLSMLTLTGIQKKTKGNRCTFVARKGMTPQQLFDRAFLECDPTFPVEFSGGTEQECETLALLCMANAIHWQCPSYPLKEAFAIQTALEQLQKEGIDLSDPNTVHRALGAVNPSLQHYYQTKCLVQDKRRLDERNTPERKEYKEEKSRSNARPMSSASSSSSSRAADAFSDTADRTFRFPSTRTERASSTRDFPHAWQRTRLRREPPTVEVLEESDAETDSDSLAPEIS